MYTELCFIFYHLFKPSHCFSTLCSFSLAARCYSKSIHLESREREQGQSKFLMSLLLKTLPSFALHSSWKEPEQSIEANRFYARGGEIAYHWPNSNCVPSSLTSPQLRKFPFHLQALVGRQLRELLCWSWAQIKTCCKKLIDTLLSLGRQIVTQTTTRLSRPCMSALKTRRWQMVVVSL